MVLTVMSWGGGSNSTAMAVGLHERNERPDLVLFADPGAELPHTMVYIPVFRDWLRDAGFPDLVTVRADGNTLEEECLKAEMLPALAYGGRSCSDKFKKRPQNNYVKAWQPAIDAWAQGEKVTRLLGFHAGEAHRQFFPNERRYTYRYPLVEWGWGQEECEEAVRRAGLPSPGKSCCWFCPAMKKGEILDLSIEHPDLAARAVAMEENANLRTVKGLGRHFSWKRFLAADAAQQKLFPPEIEMPCMCIDGDSGEDLPTGLI